MNTQDAEYINTTIKEEGFDYCFDGYSSFEDIKDERFHSLRQKYLNAKKDLKQYIQVSLPNCGVPEGIDIEAELWKALGESMKEEAKKEDLEFLEQLEKFYKRTTYKGEITELKPNQVFVFGSNTQGRHGKGAALLAKEKFGAIQGHPEGFQGQSYAIITKDLTKTVHPSVSEEKIIEQIQRLYEFANVNKDHEFIVAYKGNSYNLNAYTSQQMAVMFSKFDIPENIVFEEEFAKLIEKQQKEKV